MTVEYFGKAYQVEILEMLSQMLIKLFESDHMLANGTNRSRHGGMTLRPIVDPEGIVGTDKREEAYTPHPMHGLGYQGSIDIDMDRDHDVLEFRGGPLDAAPQMNPPSSAAYAKVVQ